jgi:hypothetical protein
MVNKYLILMVVIVSGIVVVYGAYSYYSAGNSAVTNYSDNISVSKTGTETTNSYNDTDIPGLNETGNRTNRSTISISLEKPPFVE